MSSLEAIRTIYLPASVIKETREHLYSVGLQELEGVALWAGVAHEYEFNVLKTLVPTQKAIVTDQGHCYLVDGSELHRINVWLFENRMRLLAQVHSHPNDAFHSSMDDAFPIVTTLGALSLVVPNFARDPFNLEICAAYRLVGTQMWKKISSAELRNLIKIT